MAAVSGSSVRRTFGTASPKAFQSVGDSNNFDRDHAAGLHKHPDRDCLSFSAYSLRHFCITALRYRETLSTEDLAAHATHNSPRMTLSVYTHAQHPSRAKKIFALQPLLSSDFVPGWGRKKTGLAVKSLANGVDGKYADGATLEARREQPQRQSDPPRSPQGASVATCLSREPGRISLSLDEQARPSGRGRGLTTTAKSCSKVPILEQEIGVDRIWLAATLERLAALLREGAASDGHEQRNERAG